MLHNVDEIGGQGGDCREGAGARDSGQNEGADLGQGPGGRQKLETGERGAWEENTPTPPMD